MLKLYRFLKPFTFFVISIVILVFTQVITELYLPTLMSNIVNNGVINKDINYILKTGGIMLITTAIGVICAVLASFLTAKTAVGLGNTLREKIFTKVEGFSLSEFDKFGTATLITRTTNDVNQIQQLTIMIFIMMIRAPLTSIGGIIMALREDKQLTWVLVVVIPILVLIISIVLVKGIPLFRLIQVKIDKLNLVLRENLSGIRVIRAFNRENKEKARFDAASTDLMNVTIRVNKIIALLMPLMMFIMNLTTIAIIWFGAIRIDKGNMQIGSLMAFIQYAMQILFSLLMLTFLFILVPRAQASAVRINEILDTKPEIIDPKEPVNIFEKRGVVEFRDVTFSYKGSEQPVLSNISFTAVPGEITAIIGGTGSGKSTLVNLIPRFYDVNSGSVLVDGVDVRDISQEELRAKIGFVPQNIIIFSGTIAENIRYGKKDATLEEIKHAADIAQATEFIMEMEGGFDHFISAGGTNVSGGQKQRLSIARALVRKPEIYIFDDSFSALDFKTDAKLRAALRQEVKNSTVIIIAQRVSTIMNADKIIVLDEGKIVGIGKHKELLQTCDVYREIVYSQLSEEELA
jgi:ATP-binding cassette subfamily B protein